MNKFSTAVFGTTAAVIAFGAFSAFGSTSVDVRVNTTENKKTTTHVTSSSTPRPSTVNLACMQAAVDKRDGAVISAFDIFHTSVVTALQARQSALKTAWGNTDRKARRQAISAAWRNYRKATRDARQAFRTAKHNTWKIFGTDRRACGTGALGDDGSNEAADIQL